VTCTIVLVLTDDFSANRWKSKANLQSVKNLQPAEFFDLFLIADHFLLILFDTVLQVLILLTDVAQIDVAVPDIGDCGDAPTTLVRKGAATSIDQARKQGGSLSIGRIPADKAIR
jgi:hypothetical protein